MCSFFIQSLFEILIEEEWPIVELNDKLSLVESSNIPNRIKAFIL